MTTISSDTIKKISSLANLPLTDKEEQVYAPQLNAVLGYIDKLSEVDTIDVDPTFVPTNLENVLREDEPQTLLSQEEALKNAKEVKNGLFVVESVDTSSRT